jgi:hypothetical protein
MVQTDRHQRTASQAGHGRINYLLGTKIGTHVRTNAWSFALP